MNAAQTTMAPPRNDKAKPHGNQPVVIRHGSRRNLCVVGAVLRCTHTFHGTFDGHVLGYDDERAIQLPLTLEFVNKHGDKVIERFQLDDFKDMEVLA